MYVGFVYKGRVVVVVVVVVLVVVMMMIDDDDCPWEASPRPSCFSCLCASQASQARANAVRASPVSACVNTTTSHPLLGRA